MPVVISYKFNRAFVLWAEHIIKLDEIIQKRLEEAGLSKDISYKVYMSNSITYDTANYEDIIKEENSKRNKILSLSISSCCNDMSFKLLFDNKDGVELDIEGKNRRDAYLLFGDIKSYLETEVSNIRVFNKGLKIVFTFFSAICMIIPIFLMISWSGEQAVSEALNGDTEVKLNFLIQKELLNQQQFPKLMSFMLVSLIFMLCGMLCDPIINLIQKKNVFCWGKEEIYFNKFLKLRSNIFWGIFICLVIGILASFIATYLYKYMYH